MSFIAQLHCLCHQYHKIGGILKSMCLHLICIKFDTAPGQTQYAHCHWDRLFYAFAPLFDVIFMNPLIPRILAKTVHIHSFNNNTYISLFVAPSLSSFACILLSMVLSLSFSLASMRFFLSLSFLFAICLKLFLSRPWPLCCLSTILNAVITIDTVQIGN